jgi:hypothetical protein
MVPDTSSTDSILSNLLAQHLQKVLVELFIVPSSSCWKCRHVKNRIQEPSPPQYHASETPVRHQILWSSGTIGAGQFDVLRAGLSTYNSHRLRYT